MKVVVVLICISISLFGYNSKAGEMVDVEAVLACDAVFQPQGCIGSRTAAGPHSSGWEDLRSETGIEVEPETGALEFQGNRRNFQLSGARPDRDPESRRGASAEQVHNFNNSSVSGVGNGAGGTNGNPPGASDDEDTAFDQSARQQAQAQDPYADDAGSGITGLGGGSNPGGQTMVKGGLLYASEDSGASGGANFKNGSNPDTVKSQSLASGQSAVMLNRQNSAGGPSAGEDAERSKNSSRAMASVGGGAGGSGGFSASGGSGGGGAAASGGSSTSGDGLLGRLAGIAKGLGERFFGMSGSGGSHASRMRASAALAEKNRLKRLAALSKNDPNFRDMLQKHMRRQRGLASSLEFGAKDSFLFGRVCQQYTKYANENGIPDDRVRCPNR